MVRDRIRQGDLTAAGTGTAILVATVFEAGCEIAIHSKSEQILSGIDELHLEWAKSGPVTVPSVQPEPRMGQQRRLTG